MVFVRLSQQKNSISDGSMGLHQTRSLNEQHVLVLGAYGLIGAGVVSILHKHGAKVTGFGRDAQAAQRVLPQGNWIIGDLGSYLRSENWHKDLEGVTAVVNCSGALQSGPDDDLEAIHHHMVAALAAACCERDVLLIQVSAVGASADASTDFLQSKARGDNAIRSSGVRYAIYRPGLVIACQAYGGTALLRMLTAVPSVNAVAYPEAQIQTVSLSDVSRAVEETLAGHVPDKFECDLVEQHPHSLQYVLTRLRVWLGFKPARFALIVPNMAANAISKCADFFALLGWKSPLRTTGMKVLRDGVRGDPVHWNELGLFELSSFDQTLNSMRASHEDRLAASTSLLLPFLVGTLSLFWIFSGLIGLTSLDEASDLLRTAGWPLEIAVISVVFWAFVDLALGAAILVRKYAKIACFGMMLTSVFYLCASSIFAPQLWLDPLGPLVKIFPGILLAVVTSVALENR